VQCISNSSSSSIQVRLIITACRWEAWWWPRDRITVSSLPGRSSINCTCQYCRRRRWQAYCQEPSADDREKKSQPGCRSPALYIFVLKQQSVLSIGLHVSQWFFCFKTAQCTLLCNAYMHLTATINKDSTYLLTYLLTSHCTFLIRYDTIRYDRGV